jgi:hypothetical protein
MASAERSRSNVDEEKTDIISTGEKSGSSVFLNYYEECAGRVVLDPKCVSLFLLSPWLVVLIIHALERHVLNLETRLPPASSFHRMERLSSGHSHPTIRMTLKTFVHA